MSTLICPLSSLSPELQVRTKYHHTVRGLAWNLTAPAGHDLADYRHPLAIAYLLGLASKVQWYERWALEQQVSQRASNVLLTLLVQHGRLNLDRLDTRALATRLRQYSVVEQEVLVQDLAGKLDRIYFLPKLERYIAMKDADFSKIPKDIYDRLEQHLADLEQSLIAADPMMPQHLRSSHAILVTYPETVHLLDDSDIARLIDAAEIHTKTEIVKAAAAGKGAGSRKKVSIADL